MLVPYECVCEWVNVLHNLCKAPRLKALYTCTLYHLSVYRPNINTVHAEFSTFLLQPSFDDENLEESVAEVHNLTEVGDSFLPVLFLDAV